MSFKEVRARALAGLGASGEDERARDWVAAAAAVGRGDFDQAEPSLRVLADGSPPVGLAASLTLASLLRQTGRHAEARAFDERALEGARSDAERADALIGLAADAVGMAQEARCADLLERAARAAPLDDLRVLIRLNWVRCEHALLRGRAREAAGFARVAVQECRAYGSRRHAAKSMLFLGAALRLAGDREAAHWLAEAERVATEIGARPIAEAAAGLRVG